MKVFKKEFFLDKLYLIRKHIEALSLVDTENIV